MIMTRDAIPSKIYPYLSTPLVCVSVAGANPASFSGAMSPNGGSSCHLVAQNSLAPNPHGFGSSANQVHIFRSSPAIKGRIHFKTEM